MNISLSLPLYRKREVGQSAEEPACACAHAHPIHSYTGEWNANRYHTTQKKTRRLTLEVENCQERAMPINHTTRTVVQHSHMQWSSIKQRRNDRIHAPRWRQHRRPNDLNSNQQNGRAHYGEEVTSPFSLRERKWVKPRANEVSRRHQRSETDPMTQLQQMEDRSNWVIPLMTQLPQLEY